MLWWKSWCGSSFTTHFLSLSGFTPCTKPCHHGGTCFDNGSGPRCACGDGYYGDSCEHPMGMYTSSLLLVMREGKGRCVNIQDRCIFKIPSKIALSSVHTQQSTSSLRLPPRIKKKTFSGLDYIHTFLLTFHILSLTTLASPFSLLFFTNSNLT